MNVTIHFSNIHGTVQAPASKSSMQRALAAALLRTGETVIHKPGKSDDELAAIEIIKDLGAAIKISGDELIITSHGVDPKTEEMYCGESGLAVRMFTPIVALSKRTIHITGGGSLMSRPMSFFDSFFPELGVEISSNSGRLPITIKGPLEPKSIQVDGSLSSQFITGLIMAYAAAGARNMSIKVKDLKSKGYIDLTLDVMKKSGLPVPENNNYQEFIFHGNSTNHFPSTVHYTVESDWSNAAFLLVAGAIAGPITITGLDLTSMQADKAIIDVLMQANAGIAIEAKGINVRPAEMNAFEFDATDSPDLFPPLVAMAAYCKGTSKVMGVSRLVYKESNRAQSLQNEFGKMGVKISVDDDTMFIEGAGKVQGARIHSHGDHRIAMACAVAALRANGTTVIEYAQAVRKSYPDFFAELKKLGANVSLDSEW